MSFFDYDCTAFNDFWAADEEALLAGNHDCWIRIPLGLILTSSTATGQELEASIGPSAPQVSALHHSRLRLD